MTKTVPALDTKIRNYQRGILATRIVTLVWSSVTALTFLLLCVIPQSTFDRDALPVFIGGTALAAFFVIGLSWKPWSDVERSLARVAMLLRWQVGAGALITFTIAFVARSELSLPFGVFGLYLLFTAIPLAALGLLSNPLRALYQERDQAAAEEQRRRDLDELRAAIIAKSKRPLFGWPRRHQ